jgi:hypothetical protein
MAGLLIGGCCERTVSEQISEAAERAVDDDRRALRLSRVTSFRWDRVLVFGPMTARDEMAQAAGVGEGELDSPPSGVEPDEARLVFLLGDEVVESVAVARRDVDLACLASSRALPWERATFDVREEGVGEHRRPVLLPKSGNCP